MKALLHKVSLVVLLVVLSLVLGGGTIKAQSSKTCGPLQRDTVAIFDGRIKVTLAGAFQKMPPDLSYRKYMALFSLHDIISSSGFVLQSSDTLVFYMTSINRPTKNDGGVSTWRLISSFIDKQPSYRTESGWNRLGREHLYFVKLILDAKPDQRFDFRFFFIDNKLAFSLLQRPLHGSGLADKNNFTLISPK